MKRVGCRASAEIARAGVDEDRDDRFVWGSDGEEGGSGPP